MTSLKRKQFRRVKSAFLSFSGNDRLIDYPEWKQALGIRSDFLAKRIFERVDTDETGFIDFDEFLVFAKHLYSDDKRRRLKFVFDVYDLDGDGVIDNAEIETILRAALDDQSVTLPDETLRALAALFLRKADLNKDGRVDLDEFVEVVGEYPGIEQQFSVYAADWLNEGKGFDAPRVKAANLKLRLSRYWHNRRYAFSWTALYVLVNLGVFAWTMLRQTELGADLAMQLARAAGACLNLNAALVLLPVCKSLWTWIRPSRVARYFPLDHLVGAHRLIGHAIGAFAALHVGAHFAHMKETSRGILHELFTTPLGISGVAATVVLVTMLFYSRYRRTRIYERFTLTHLLYPLFLAGLLWHSKDLWMWLTAPLLLFAIDRGIRWFVKRRKVTVLAITPHANGATRVRIRKPKNFTFQPGDYLRLNFGELSRFQWHPFTISAAPEAEELDVFVRNNGDWTGALHNLSRNKSYAGKRWSARIDGPYSSSSSGIYRSKVAVLVAAGIGVTPFASALQSILLRYRKARSEKSKPDQIIHFHWLNRSHRSYEWFLDLLAQAEQTLGQDQFKLHIHLTSLTHDLTNIAMQIAMDAYYALHGRDPMTNLNAETSAGHPDWDSVFSAVAAAHPNETIDVYYCGPPSLGKIVKRKCRRHGLVYHEEKF